MSQVAKFARRWDDDYIDRLNHRFTTLMLVVMTVVVSYKQYVGEPIVCWTEGQWTGTHMCYYYHGFKEAILSYITCNVVLNTLKYSLPVLHYFK